MFFFCVLPFTSHALVFGPCVFLWYYQPIIIYIYGSCDSLKILNDQTWVPLSKDGTEQVSCFRGFNVPLDFLPPGFLSCCSVSVPSCSAAIWFFPWSQVLWRICLVNASLIIYSSLSGRPQSSVMRPILFTASSYYYILIFFFYYLVLSFVVWYILIFLSFVIFSLYIYSHT